MGKFSRKQSFLWRRASLPVLIVLCGLAALLVWLPMLVSSGCAFGPSLSGLSTLKKLRDGEKPAEYVAHALGEIDGNFYTNSRDAFLLNYDRGYRTFEVDLVLLQDGSAFCAHDGAEWMYGLDKPFIETTAAEISDKLCLGKYTPLTGRDLLDLVNEYTDAVFLLDTKRTAQDSNHAILEVLTSEGRRRHASALDRMIPHTFGSHDLRQVSKIHRFSEYWVAVYSFRSNIRRSFAAEADRVVVYLISNGGPAGLRGTADIKLLTPSWGAALEALSRLRCPGLCFIPCLWGTRLCVSLDIMDANTEAVSS